MKTTVLKKGVLSQVVCLMSVGAFASGFGLYEASSPTYALGGAVVGRAYDASANFHNPATLTDLTNVTVTVGAMTEHPRAKLKVSQGGRDVASSSMNSGCYLLPHFHLAVPLPADFAFGLGMMPEYGLGSVYDDLWPLAYAGIDTQVESFTINPNLAYKVTDKLSIGAGLRFIYWDFEQISRPGSYSPYYRMGTRLKGDNGMKDYGYQVGLKYDLFDNFALGLVYKSDVGCHVDGKREDTGYVTTAAGKLSQNYKYDAEATIHMPQSITGGFNWDITDDWHLGGMLAWTQWSAVDIVYFNFMDPRTCTKQQQTCSFNWLDTWRAGIAPSWDFAEDWTWMCSYVFETDCSRDQYSVMLPLSDRHMVSTGVVWHCWAGLELGLTYGVILMDGRDSHVSLSRPTDTYCAHHGISHAAGLTVTYRF